MITGNVKNKKAGHIKKERKKEIGCDLLQHIVNILLFVCKYFFIL